MRVIAQGRLTQHSWEDEQHVRRTSVELQVDEIGPSLRYATAQVAKATRGTAGPAGYSGGSTTQTDPQAPASDPWGASDQAASSSSFGSFGKSAEPEPEF